MYCVELKIQPTAAMTFRVLPGSILNIATYPFVPPTTLSGFLRRLGMMSVGLEIPETRINSDNPPVYALPPHYLALGAYPAKGTWSAVHRTYRKGMREFNHDAFSRIYQDGEKANFQLHTWEYFIAEKLTGYVLADSRNGLEYFQELVGYGCKLGKEGFAIVSEVSEIVNLYQETAAKYPSTIVPMEALLQSQQFVSGCDIYNMYRYKWARDTSYQSEQEGFLDNRVTKIEGFIPFVTAYFTEDTGNPPTLEYFTDGNEINIPVSLVNLLRGEAYV
ncbi:hypothetical protein [Chroococcidiopsis thermalis]|uniref:CRISPR-associated protein Cas5 n=1 Tax=Chroococcidiopsis thermalis (strain PCC 7203) TaxID=251229 RepID=K9U230_CHRTP|nr:hypothetical protein [Chroococcidiopsis thermalis]AFY88491.1 hypothetical protein Chro_3024 [Chroococcidiopsis thermalis PCC 7203]